MHWCVPLNHTKERPLWATICHFGHSLSRNHPEKPKWRIISHNFCSFLHIFALHILRFLVAYSPFTALGGGHPPPPAKGGMGPPKDRNFLSGALHKNFCILTHLESFTRSDLAVFARSPRCTFYAIILAHTAKNDKNVWSRLFAPS